MFTPVDDKNMYLNEYCKIDFITRVGISIITNRVKWKQFYFLFRIRVT